MDELQEWEAIELLSNLAYVDCTSWEQTRILLSTQVDRKKTPKLTDIIKFPWDKKDPNDKWNNMTEKEQEEYRNKQREWLRQLAMRQQKQLS